MQLSDSWPSLHRRSYQNCEDMVANTVATVSSSEGYGDQESSKGRVT